MVFRFILAAFAMATLSPGTAEAQSAPPVPLRPVHTFSIVARDPATGELGVAVQSHWFGVGPIVPWIEAGVGAVATQSFVDPSYGKLGLDLMRAGKSAPDSLKALIAGDAASDVRQVAMIDAQGHVAAHTGAKDIQAAGHHIGVNYSVQANLMLNESIWPAMSRAFESAKATLPIACSPRSMPPRRPEVIFAAVNPPRSSSSAASRPGSRGLIARLICAWMTARSRSRNCGAWSSCSARNAGDLAVERKDNQGALREYSAAAALAPGNMEMVYWHAVALVSMGRTDESLPLFRQVFRAERNWLTLTPRLAAAGLLPKDQRVIDRILKAGTP
jgi:hypothetical protein